MNGNLAYKEEPREELLDRGSPLPGTRKKRNTGFALQRFLYFSGGDIQRLILGY